MDNKYLTIKLVSNNKTLILDNEYYKIVDLEGVDSADYELNLIPNAQYDGSMVNGKRVDKRPISITADFSGDNKEIERQKLISFFNPKFIGVLIINYCGLERAIEYEIEAFDSKINNIYDKLTFTVDLICPKPYFKNVIENKVNIALWKGKFHFPLIIPKDTGIIMGLREPSLIVNINNVGNVESGMTIEFKALGTLKNPSLFNINTREYFKINKTMVAGEVIKASTVIGKKKVIQNINGVEINILNLIDLDSDFLQLKQGDNLLRYDAEENINNLEMSIYYNPSYLGV